MGMNKELTKVLTVQEGSEYLDEGIENWMVGWNAVYLSTVKAQRVDIIEKVAVQPTRNHLQPNKPKQGWALHSAHSHKKR